MTPRFRTFNGQVAVYDPVSREQINTLTEDPHFRELLWGRYGYRCWRLVWPSGEARRLTSADVAGWQEMEMVGV